MLLSNAVEYEKGGKKDDEVAWIDIFVCINDFSLHALNWNVNKHVQEPGVLT